MENRKNVLDFFPPVLWPIIYTALLNLGFVPDAKPSLSVQAQAKENFLAAAEKIRNSPPST
jgi:hypothetical protein